MLKAEVRAAALGQKRPGALALPDRRKELAQFKKLPPQAGMKSLGPFAVEATLGVGEGDPELTFPAEPGIWLAYRTFDEDGEAVSLEAVHADSLAELDELRREARREGEANSEGARIAVFDAVASDDDEFFDEVMQAADGPVGQRCVVVSIGGDGTSTVLTASKRDKAVYVRVDFR